MHRSPSPSLNWKRGTFASVVLSCKNRPREFPRVPDLRFPRLVRLALALTARGHKQENKERIQVREIPLAPVPSIKILPLSKRQERNAVQCFE